MEKFEQELGYIKNPTIRKFAEVAIESFPSYFWSIPASSTGKYHPQFATGSGGLYRHVRAAVGIAVELFRMRMFNYFTDDEKDLIIATLICHDSFKSGVPQAKFTKFNHPTIACEELSRNEKLRRIISPEYFGFIMAGIGSHMGQWNVKDECSLPLPETKAQNFIHLVDYLSSRKILEYNFDVKPVRE